MRINGTEINAISLTHKGYDFHLKRITPEYDPNDFEHNAEIVFTDLLEVEQLIDILSRFKKGCLINAGVWCGDIEELMKGEQKL